MVGAHPGLRRRDPDRRRIGEIAADRRAEQREAALQQLRRRRGGEDAAAGALPPRRVPPPGGLPPPRDNLRPYPRTSHLYCLASFLAAMLAIVLSPVGNASGGVAGGGGDTPSASSSSTPGDQQPFPSSSTHIFEFFEVPRKAETRGYDGGSGKGGALDLSVEGVAKAAAAAVSSNAGPLPGRAEEPTNSVAVPPSGKKREGEAAVAVQEEEEEAAAVGGNGKGEAAEEEELDWRSRMRELKNLLSLDSPSSSSSSSPQQQQQPESQERGAAAALRWGEGDAWAALFSWTSPYYSPSTPSSSESDQRGGDRGDGDVASVGRSEEDSDDGDREPSQHAHPHLPLRWLLHGHRGPAPRPTPKPSPSPEEKVEGNDAPPPRRTRRRRRSIGSIVRSLVDPSVADLASGGNVTDVVDKVLTSTPRLLAVANLLLAVTYLLHGAVADLFLGPDGGGGGGGAGEAGGGGGRNGADLLQGVGGGNNDPGVGAAASDAASQASRERLGGFLVFKLLLISAVVAPDTLDLLILLGWYTLLSFLRSLSSLAAGSTSRSTRLGRPPRPGVPKLLAAVLLCDFAAAAACAALFHGAGWGMVALLTCDCALLAVDALCHVARHAGQVLEERHGREVSEVEGRQLELHAAGGSNGEDGGGGGGRRGDAAAGAEAEVVAAAAGDDDDAGDDDRDEGTAGPPPPPAPPRVGDDGNGNNDVDARIRALDRRVEELEASHARRLSILDDVVFGLEMVSCVLTVGHFAHIWTLHGLQFTLIDGVLALHLHGAVSAAGRKIAERRNLNRISRDLDGLFPDATELEMRKASAAGDVCCICLGTMSLGSVKKVGCGHLYHTHCLREVVERARSVEAARCPLCRACVVDGRHRPAPTVGGNPVGGGGDDGPAVGGADADGGARRRQQQQRRGVGGEARPLRANDNAPGNGGNVGGGGGGGGGGGEHALFRFSTEGILPAWLPLPAFSFEVVRRPPTGGGGPGPGVAGAADGNNNNTNNGGGGGGGGAAEGNDDNEGAAAAEGPERRADADGNDPNQPRRQEPQTPPPPPEQSFWRRLLVLAGAIPMSPEEEAVAVDNLVDMFPQYDRSDLRRELRERGSAEAVVEAVLLGAFGGVPRGGGVGAAGLAGGPPVGFGDDDEAGGAEDGIGGGGGGDAVDDRAGGDDDDERHPVAFGEVAPPPEEAANVAGDDRNRPGGAGAGAGEADEAVDDAAGTASDGAVAVAASAAAAAMPVRDSTRGEDGAVANEDDVAIPTGNSTNDSEGNDRPADVPTTGSS